MRTHAPRLQTRWCTAALALLTVCPAAQSTTLERVTARERIRDADLIVLGTVMDVAYRNAQVRDAGDVELPHTFVTIAIERTFKGTRQPGESLTLRMQGGPDGRGRTLQVMGIPRFHDGDQDVFFIAGNSTAACPLVGWEQGRLRVVRGELFNDQGQELWLSPQGDFVFGDVTIEATQPGHPPRVINAASADPDADRFAPPAGSLRADDRHFGDLLELMVRTMQQQGELPPIVATADAPIDAPFHVRHFVATAAPVDRGSREQQRGDYDAREAELIRRIRAGQDTDGH